MKPSLSIIPAEVEQLPVPAEPPDLDRAFALYSRYVARLALRLLGRDDEVDDVVQDVFLAAWRGLRHLRDPLAVKGWLATVTVRLARRRLRLRRLWRACGVMESSGYDGLAAPGASPEQRALLARVYSILDELPAAERLAWTLRHVEGERLEQVAAHCGCSLATAKRRIAAAHGAIETAVRDE